MRWAALFTIVAALGYAGGVHAQPQLPATFYGSASIDGAAPPADSDVRALIDGVDCTQEGPARRFALDGGVGVYVITVVHDSQKAGCGRDGKRVTFTVGGRQANESGTWKAGPQELNLNAGSGQPAQLPTQTPAPAGRTPANAGTAVQQPSTPRPGTPPVDPITLTPGASGGTLTVSTPGAPGGEGTPILVDPVVVEDEGSSVLLPVVGVLAVISIAAAAAGLVLSRRRGPTSR